MVAVEDPEDEGFCDMGMNAGKSPPAGGIEVAPRLELGALVLFEGVE